MSTVDLMGMKESFSLMVQKVQPWILSHFMIWLDLKVAEYKVHGHMILDQTGLPTLNWLSDNVFAQPSKAPRSSFKENSPPLEFQVNDQSQLVPITKQYSISSSGAKSFQSGSKPNSDTLPSPPSSSTSLSVSTRNFATSAHVQDLTDSSRSEEIITSLMSIASQEQQSHLVNEIDLQTHNLNTVASRSNYQTTEQILPTSEFMNKNSIDLTDEPEIKTEPLSPNNVIILENPISLNSNESFMQTSNQDGSGSRVSQTEETIHLPSGPITIHVNNENSHDNQNLLVPLQTQHTPTHSQQEVNNSRNVHLSPLSLSSSEMSQEFNDRLIVQNISSFKLPNPNRKRVKVSLTTRVNPSGRKSDPIWQFFEKIPSKSGKGCRAKCKKCHLELQGLVARLKIHRMKCQKYHFQRKIEEEENDPAGPSLAVNKKRGTGKGGGRPLNVTSSKIMCQICGTFFRCKSSLSRHKWLHGEKRHRCFLCEKAFHRKEHLYLHFERHAKCRMCHIKGNDMQAIQEHFRQCHPDAT